MKAKPFNIYKTMHFISASEKDYPSTYILSTSAARSITQCSKTKNILSIFTPTATSFRFIILGWQDNCYNVFTSLKHVMGNPSF